MLIALVGGCTYYLVRGATRTPGTVDIVAYLDTIGPVWPILLGLGAIAVLVAMFVPHAAVLGHTIAVAVLLAYSAALWWGVTTGSNGWVTASFALALAIHTSILTSAYARSQSWMPR